MPTKYVRVRPSYMGGPCAVRHPETGDYIVPNPAQPYPADDPIVRAYPWLFVGDDALPPEEVPDSVRVEDASARPGTRRGRAR